MFLNTLRPTALWSSMKIPLVLVLQIIDDLEMTELKDASGNIFGTTNNVQKLVYSDIKRWLKAQDMIGNLPDADKLLYIRSKVILGER